MSGKALGPGRYFLEDVEPGDRIVTPSLTLDVSMIDRFAELTGDRFEIHMSRDGAAKHGFPDRVAHGLLILSLVDGLKNQSEAQFAAVASLGWEWNFSGLVLPGDTIHAEMTILTKRETRRADRGIVTIDFAVLNQHGSTVQSGVNTLMVLRRPTA